MSGCDATRAGFIAMLRDDQFGKFLAHEGNPSCIAAMEDTLTAKQYKVFETLMKMKETATNGSNTNNPPIPRNAPTPKPKNVPATTIPETDSRIDAYAHTTEVIIPTAHGGKIVGAGGETVKRLTKDSNTKIQLNKNGANTYIRIGADKEEELVNAQKLIWKELETTFSSSAVVCVYDKQILQLCSKWSEVERYDFQSDTLVTVDYMALTDFDAFVSIRGWDQRKCENAHLKLKAIVNGSGRVPIIARRHSRLPNAQPKDDGLEKYPNAMNILMLGESGVGKSTFLNAMVNYMKYNSLKQAEHHGPTVLIRSMANVNGENIIVEPTEEPEKAAQHAKNEVLEDGQSATQSPQTYILSYPANGTEKTIRIIDTPGVDDTRGFDTSKENSAKILGFLADYEQIHAVCILLRPDVSRISLAFKYCLKELLVHLHKSATSNILFCFTRTKGESSGSWQTPTILKGFLDDLEKQSDIKIELNQNSMFYFDSESFKYLAGKRAGGQFPAYEVQSYTSSWSKSSKETLRLLERITALPPHNVNDTLCLNNTKRIIQLLSKPLAEITSSIMNNRDLLNEKQREIKKAIADGRSLEGQLIVEQETPVAVELGYPMTVCTAPKCVQYGKIGKIVQTLYVQECHQHCYLTNVQVKTCPNAALRGCAAMSGENCTQCRCSWKDHMHIRYKIEKTIEKIESKKISSKINEMKSAVEEGNQFLDILQDKLNALDRKKNEITNLCAQFATFLEKNSILTYNDAFLDYLGYLIRNEKEKIAANSGLSNEQLLNLQKYKEEYEKEVSLIKLSSKTNEEVTVEDINNSIQMLMNMQGYGTFLREVQRLEMLTIGAATENLSQTIKLKSWKKVLAINSK